MDRYFLEMGWDANGAFWPKTTWYSEGETGNYLNRDGVWACLNEREGVYDEFFDGLGTTLYRTSRLVRSRL